jgi:hypothetical protein
MLSYKVVTKGHSIVENQQIASGSGHSASGLSQADLWVVWVRTVAAARAGEGTALFELLLRTPSHADGVGASAQWDNASKEVRKIPVTRPRLAYAPGWLPPQPRFRPNPESRLLFLSPKRRFVPV